MILRLSFFFSILYFRTLMSYENHGFNSSNIHSRFSFLETV